MTAMKRGNLPKRLVGVVEVSCPHRTATCSSVKWTDENRKQERYAVASKVIATQRERKQHATFMHEQAVVRVLFQL